MDCSSPGSTVMGFSGQEYQRWEAVLRWWRNRTGRPLYLPQIHWKIIWMLNNFHETTFEHWWRTPGTQKASPFSLKGGRTKYKRQKRGWRPVLGKELWRSFQTPGNSLTGGSVGSFGISEGNIIRKLTHTHTHTHRIPPNHNSQWRRSPDACCRHQWAGAEQGGTGCMLRVRTRPEYPEDNLRELTWDSNPNCGAISREKKKKERERERERARERAFPQKALI